MRAFQINNLQCHQEGIPDLVFKRLQLNNENPFLMPVDNQNCKAKAGVGSGGL